MESFAFLCSYAISWVRCVAVEDRGEHGTLSLVSLDWNLK
jgi:hypothetical protein